MSAKGPIRSFYDITGWFRWLDKTIFDAILTTQAHGPKGDFVELGAYLGKSAVVIGGYLREGERFVVVDLFEDAVTAPPTDDNRRENISSYSSLTRQEFERNYLALLPELPEVVMGLSSSVVDHVAPGSCRFMHVDASHMYVHVHEDALNARRLLAPGGVVAFDDYRAEHTPGVSAAVWQAVLEDGLVPFVLTPHKLYGVYDDPEPYVGAVRELFLSDQKHYWFEEQEILGRRVLRARPRPQPTNQQVVPLTAKDLESVANDIVDRVGLLLEDSQRRGRRRPKGAGKDPVSRGRGVASDLTPPALSRWLARQRALIRR